MDDTFTSNTAFEREKTQFKQNNFDGSIKCFS